MKPVPKYDLAVFLGWLFINALIFGVKYHEIRGYCGAPDGLEAYSFLGTTDYACQTSQASCCKPYGPNNEPQDQHHRPCQFACADPCNLFARCTGHLLNFNMALILIPILRNSLYVHLPYIGVPFERAVRAHRYFGYAVFSLMVMHMLGWWTSYPPVSTGWTCWSWTFGFRSDMFKGHIAFIIHLVQAVLALEYVRRNYFELFFFSHLLYIPLYIMAIWHTMGVQQYDGSNMFDFKSDYLIYYLAVPFLLYFIDRAIRFYRSHFVRTKLLSAETCPGGVVKLEIERKTRFEPGQYCFLYIPGVSWFEWHPFSISSAPDRNRVPSANSRITFHIKDMGHNTWTGKLRQLVENSHDLQFSVKVDGPYGKVGVPLNSCPTIVLFAGGVGVTPMMSILLSLFREPGLYPQLRKVHFHWSFKDVDQCAWFDFLWQEMYPNKNSEVATVVLGNVEFKVQFHVSDLEKARKKERDARVSRAQAQNASAVNEPLIRDKSESSSSNVLDLPRPLFNAGRPPIHSIFTQLLEEDPDPIGVYTCGPDQLMASIAKECARDKRFRLHQETFAL